MAEIELLILDRDIGNAPAAETRFGGAPSVDGGFIWPVCKVCAGNMQFLGQIRREGAPRLHLIFMCQNDPGVCSEWEADRGANAIMCVGVDALGLADIPPQGEVVRETLYGARIERVESTSYDKARAEWAGRHPGRQREVLGQIGGQADWLDGDETPTCDHCRKPMGFVAQLEEGPEYQTAMNFAGRCGYVFDCDCAGGVGKFLW